MFLTEVEVGVGHRTSLHKPAQFWPPHSGCFCFHIVSHTWLRLPSLYSVEAKEHCYLFPETTPRIGISPLPSALLAICSSELPQQEKLFAFAVTVWGMKAVIWQIFVP